jgi:hypothetical protein
MQAKPLVQSGLSLALPSPAYVFRVFEVDSSSELSEEESTSKTRKTYAGEGKAKDNPDWTKGFACMQKFDIRDISSGFPDWKLDWIQRLVIRISCVSFH